MQIEADQSVCPACGPGSRWIYLSEMPARRRVGRPRLRDRRDKRALCAMWQGDGGVATPSADIRGKPELMSAMGHQRKCSEG
jgi:hypothetical protein